jgi:LacI family transcriptional regulator
MFQFNVAQPPVNVTLRKRYGKIAQYPFALADTMKTIPKVALLIETSRGYGRGMLRGIMRYAQLHGPWALHVMPGDLAQTLPMMRQWGGTGIIARIDNPRIGRAILHSQLPTVALDLSDKQLEPTNPLSRLCEVRMNSPAVGRLAAEHLLERGLPQYAYVGTTDGVNWCRWRCEGFCRRLAEAGFDCHVYRPPRNFRDCDWGRESKRLTQWLKALPKPIGLMATNDVRGRQVLDVCREASLRVPNDIAVVSVDNDELLCELCDPPLSSVQVNTDVGGYEAAALLDRLMHGHVRSRKVIQVEPIRIVGRRSTETNFLADQEMAVAVRFIYENAGRPIQVKDVVRCTGLSRRTLELKFQRLLGRSILSEIQRCHLDRVKSLLLETDMPGNRIAAECGFGSESYLGKVFRQTFGMTLRQYRTQIRAR